MNHSIENEILKLQQTTDLFSEKIRKIRQGLRAPPADRMGLARLYFLILSLCDCVENLALLTASSVFDTSLTTNDLLVENSRYLQKCLNQYLTALGEENLQ